MELITDRTAGAVYSYSDLNRVEAAVAEIATHFAELGVEDDVVTKTDWGFTEMFSSQEWPVKSQMDRYLKNVLKIKRIFPNNVRLPASMDNLTWTSANNIEKVLQIAAGRIEGIKQAYKYSGETYAGEEII